MIECHSPQPKCIPIPICPPIINCCCGCPTKCICFTNCCQEKSNNNIRTENGVEQCQDQMTYEIDPKTSFSPNLRESKSQKFTLRNCTPDIRNFNKTNSYFNIETDNANENFITNAQTPIDDHYKYETSRKNYEIKSPLSITRNNSINYTYRKKLNNNREFIKNKEQMKKKYELLDKIKCISHRIDQTLSLYNNRPENQYTNEISKNKFNISSYYNKRFNSNENYENNKKNNKKPRNQSRILDEMNQIRLQYGNENDFLEKMKKNNEREKQLISMKIKNLSDVINNGNNVYKKISN